MDLIEERKLTKKRKWEVSVTPGHHISLFIHLRVTRGRSLASTAKGLAFGGGPRVGFPSGPASSLILFSPLVTK